MLPYNARATAIAASVSVLVRLNTTFLFGYNDVCSICCPASKYT